MDVTVATMVSTAQKNVTINILDQTALKCVTQLVKAATNRQGYVIMGAILDGGDSFVKILAIRGSTEKIVACLVDTVLILNNVTTSTEYV